MELQITREQADEIMTKRGYTSVSHNQSGDVVTKVNYVRVIVVEGHDTPLHIYCTINLIKASADISFVELRRMCQLLLNSIAYNHPDFDQFEQILAVYAAKCIGIEPVEILNGWLKTVPEREEEHVDDFWEPVTAPPAAPIVKEDKPEKKDIKTRKREFWDTVKPIAQQRGWDKDQTLKFYNYWTEESKSGKKFRRENEQFFDINKRMSTFDRFDNERVKARVSYQVNKATSQNAEVERRKTTTINTKEVF